MHGFLRHRPRTGPLPPPFQSIDYTKSNQYQGVGNRLPSQWEEVQSHIAREMGQQGVNQCGTLYSLSNLP